MDEATPQAEQEQDQTPQADLPAEGAAEVAAPAPAADPLAGLTPDQRRYLEVGAKYAPYADHLDGLLRERLSPKPEPKADAKQPAWRANWERFSGDLVRDPDGFESSIGAVVQHFLDQRLGELNPKIQALESQLGGIGWRMNNPHLAGHEKDVLDAIQRANNDPIALASELIALQKGLGPHAAKPTPTAADVARQQALVAKRTAAQGPSSKREPGSGSSVSAGRKPGWEHPNKTFDRAIKEAQAEVRAS